MQTEKTLVFCTSYASLHSGPYYSWDVRYRIWFEAIKRSGLQFDQMLIIDDGSENLPGWDDIHILHENYDLHCDAHAVLYHFRSRLGRHALSDFPGWVRSFFFASRYAEANGFTRLVHVEADAFLITQRAYDCVNALQDGWTAFWCSRFNRPEGGIQIIAGSALRTYKSWATRPIDSFAGLVIEKTLPFTNIERKLAGDRYGEYAVNCVPRTADWCMQAVPKKAKTYASYFWWLPWLDTVLPGLTKESV